MSIGDHEVRKTGSRQRIAPAETRYSYSFCVFSAASCANDVEVRHCTLRGNPQQVPLRCVRPLLGFVALVCA